MQSESEFAVFYPVPLVRHAWWNYLLMEKKVRSSAAKSVAFSEKRRKRGGSVNSLLM